MRCIPSESSCSRALRRLPSFFGHVGAGAAALVELDVPFSVIAGALEAVAAAVAEGLGSDSPFPPAVELPPQFEST